MKILENINKATTIDIKLYSTGNKCKSKILKCKNIQNVACHSNIDGACPFTTSSTVQSTTMTDEQINTSKNKDGDYKKTSTIDSKIKEYNKLLCNDSDTNTKVKTHNSILKETPKIFLRNGLNGTNTAAAAATATASLLTTAENCQLPDLSPSFTSHTTTDIKCGNVAVSVQLPPLTSSVVVTNAIKYRTQENSESVLLKPLMPSQAVNSTHLILSNTLLDCNFVKATTTTISNTFTNSDKLNKLKKKGSTSKASLVNIGNIDYSTNSSTTRTLTGNLLLTSRDAKFLSNNTRSNDKSTPLLCKNPVSGYFNNTVSSGNHGYFDYKYTKFDEKFISHTYATSYCNSNAIYSTSTHLNNSISYSNTLSQVYGGRLQFFKDGKFILELARSKVGEKNGWVSVPRKQFRAPTAATSATVTPSSLTNFAVQTPLVTPTATVTSAAFFSKNECSNSLSFSDDNSSIQSSPWQRDHSWKQLTPQKNISKEMSLFYQRVRWVQLTPQGRNWSRTKRRKPYDQSILTDELLFQHRVVVYPRGKKDTNTTNEMVLDALEFKFAGEHTNIKSKSIEKSNINFVGNEPSNKDKQNLEESPLSAIKSLVSFEIDDDTLLVKKKTICQASESRNSPESIEKDDVCNNTWNDVLKIKPNTIMLSNKINQLSKKSKYKPKKTLSNIVQKLLEISCKHCIMNRSLQLPAPFSLRSSVAVCTSNSFTVPHLQNHSNISMGHKSSSPSSNISTTRLVDCHQQHVSPRKRILREFEKVSLEDNSRIAGGKRSRAKGNIAFIGTIGTSLLDNNSNSTASSISPHSSTGLTSNFLSKMPSAVDLNKDTAACTTSAPTRLYSSYSILSLLGGTSDISRCIKKNDVAAETTINGNVHCQISSYNSLPLSTKSPESFEGKSPINTSTKLKRSPPYISSTYDIYSGSTTADNTYSDYGKRSQRSTADTAQSNFQKLPYACNSEHNPSTSNNLANQPSNYIHHNSLDTHQRTYYSPYITSPHYTPQTNISMTNSSTTILRAVSISNSPLRHTSAFKVATPTTVISSLTSADVYIPIKRDHSPTRSLVDSPRDINSKTVPKKTASLRRQFSSATTCCGMVHNCCTSEELNQHDIQEDHTHIKTRTKSTTICQQQNQLSIQCVSPSSVSVNEVTCGSAVTSSDNHTYSYIYPEIMNNSVRTTTILTTNAMTATSTISSYIPSVIDCSYHPYISTLAAMRHPQMWMQYYQDAAVVAVGVAAATSPSLLQTHRQQAALTNPRLSPPCQSLQYNGISNAAAMAAAVVAAASFGNHSASPSTISPVASHNPFFANLGTARIEGSSFAEKIDAYNAKLTTSSNKLTSAKCVSPVHTSYSSNASNNVFKISSSMSSQPSSFSLLHSASFSSSSNSRYQLNHKLEQTADLPLNLSKH